AEDVSVGTTETTDAADDAPASVADGFSLPMSCPFSPVTEHPACGEPELAFETPETGALLSLSKNMELRGVCFGATPCGKGAAVLTVSPASNFSGPTQRLSLGLPSPRVMGSMVLRLYVRFIPALAAAPTAQARGATL